MCLTSSLQTLQTQAIDAWKRTYCASSSDEQTVQNREKRIITKTLIWEQNMRVASRGIIILSIIFLSGCGLSQSYRVQQNRNISDLTLCQSLQNKDNYMRFLPKSYKSDLESEASRRGVTCGSVLQAEDNRLAAEKIADQERGRANLQSIGRILDKTVDVLAGIGASQAQQQAQQGSNISRLGFGAVCQKKYEWTSGMNKNCSYDCLGSETVQTISAASICPISITR